MVDWLRGFESRMMLIPSVYTCCGHFAWHWARQCTNTRAFYIAALSIIFLLLGFRQWRSRTDRVLTLSMNILLPLFWSTWSPALGPNSATCAGLAHGRDYSGCRALELKLQKFLATVFSWILEITFKQWPSPGLLWGFSNPHPQNCLMVGN